MAASNAEPKSNDTSPSPSLSSPFLSETVELEVLDEPQQLGHGETEHISTLPFRKCSITTKITDLRRCWFRDGREGRREACVIVFELEFGGQVRGSGQRITECGVWVMFEEVEEEEEEEGEVPPTPNPSKPILKPQNPDLDIKATYPRLAHGPLSEQTITSSLSASLTPNVNSLSLGSLSLSRETARVEPHWASYSASSAGAQGVRIALSENALLKTGIPERVRFAVLLRTDGLPFNAELRFAGRMRQFGVRVGAKRVVGVGRRYLWFRKGEEGEGFGEGGEDADGEGFGGWVRGKTENRWAERVEYD